MSRFALLALLLAPVHARSQSLMFRGTEAHTGSSDGRMFSGQGGIRWKVATGGAIRSSPAVTTDRVYVGSSDGFLYAIDRATGRLAWRTAAGSPVHGSPAVIRTVIVATTLGGRTVGLDAASGRIRWSHQSGTSLPSNTRSRPTYDYEYFVASPVVAGSTVVVGTWDGAVVALALTSGRVLWRKQTSGRIVGTPAIADGMVYAPSFDGKLYALDLTTGAERWVFRTVGDTIDLEKTGYDRRGIQGSPAVARGLVYFGSRDGGLYAVNAATGAQAWRVSHGGSWIVGSPAIDSAGRVFVGSSDARFVQAVDAATGRELWRVRTRGNVQASPLRIANLVIAATYTNQPEDGPAELFALDANTGERHWRLTLDAPTVSSVTAAGGELYLGTDAGSVLAVHETNPTPVRLAVFYDSTLTARSALRGSRLALEYFRSAGYEVLSSDSLPAFLAARVADMAPSAVVFATDALPPGVAPTLSDTVLFRRYLDAGGKVVWMGIPAGIVVRDSLGSRVNADVPGSERLLGVSYDSIMFDNLPVVPTRLGRTWGITRVVTGDFAVQPRQVLSLGGNSFGSVAAWIRVYRADRPGSGYVQLWGLGATPDRLEMARAVTEYGLTRLAPPPRRRRGEPALRSQKE